MLLCQCYIHIYILTLIIYIRTPLCLYADNPKFLSMFVYLYWILISGFSLHLSSTGVNFFILIFISILIKIDRLPQPTCPTYCVRQTNLLLHSNYIYLYPFFPTFQPTLPFIIFFFFEKKHFHSSSLFYLHSLLIIYIYG